MAKSEKKKAQSMEDKEKQMQHDVPRKDLPVGIPQKQ